MAEEKKSKIEKFNFWCPLDIQKSVIDPETGQEIMRLGGIASTSDEDSDGEFLDPKGFDIKPLINSGMVNWHHQAKGSPATIVGEPSKAEIRKDGLYIETDLYPSSAVARDIWELAQTLEKDSKTRRLGYSIEGKVVKRKSNDPKSPDYKKITKAIITGVAITHQPKNPKTFANIIKGEIDDWNDDEETIDLFDGKGDSNNLMDKLNKKDSDDKKKKLKTISKGEFIYKLLKDVTNIEIEKAENIYLMTSKIANMKGRKEITDEDISKAYEALGLEFESAEDTDIQKGEDCDANGGRTEKKTISKAKKTKKAEDDEEDDDYEDEEEVEEREAKTKERLGGIKGDEKLHREAQKRKMEKGEDDETEDDEPEDEEDDRSGKIFNRKTGKTVKKAIEPNRFDRIEKAMAVSYANQHQLIRALGVMIKNSNDKVNSVISQNEELLDIVKAQEETISELSERLEEYGSSAPGFKSHRSVQSVERGFAKAEDSDITKGGQQRLAINQIAHNDKAAIVELLDQATFAKGYDEEFSKACTTYEGSGVLPRNIIARIKNELGYEIV